VSEYVYNKLLDFLTAKSYNVIRKDDNMKKKQVTIYLPEQIVKEAKIRSIQLGISLSEYIETMIKKERDDKK
jgi:predicted DNA binding CopG/RHH family protein